MALRILDLKSAYKQIPLAQESAWASVIMIWNADAKEYQLYLPVVLPFGATAAVYGFARIARSLRLIGSRLFSLI